MEQKQIHINIDGKPAHGLMLKNRLKRYASYYGDKIDRFFVEGHWPRD